MHGIVELDQRTAVFLEIGLRWSQVASGEIKADESTIKLQDETISTQQATIEDQRRECEELSVAAEALLKEMAEELREKERV